MTTFDQYQFEAGKTAIYPGAGNSDSYEGLAYAAMGLAGEAGEILNKVKKILRDQGGVISDDNREVVADELADVLWYAAQLATQLDFALGYLARRNLAKLKSRQERGVLQGSGDKR